MKHQHLTKSIICHILLALAFLFLFQPAYAHAAAPVLAETPAFAAPSAEEMAAALKELGLFKGTNRGFELDKPCDRLMGAVILVRLLGREQQALNDNYSHPFRDIGGSYAEPYIAYLYQNGLANGVSADIYGQETMTGQQFAALLLRALGYQDGIDFSWNAALTSLADLGVLTGAEANDLQTDAFLRAQAALLCYRALQATPKQSERPLIHRLLWEDVFTTRQLAKCQNARLLLAADMPDSMTFQVRAYTEQEFHDIIWLALRNRQSNLQLYAPGLLPEQAQAIVDNILEPYFSRDFMIEMKHDGYSGYYLFAYIGEYMAMQFYYQSPQRYAKNYQFYESDYQKPLGDYIGMYVWRDKIDALVSSLIQEGMSEYQRVKALHDYVADNTVYDSNADSQSISHFADGVLFYGKGVCDGYASALKMLMNGAGIECRVIYGETPREKHAWNQVKIDGEWYNVDVTWASTIGGQEVYYGYFLAPDNIFLRDHTPEKDNIAAPCTSTLYYHE